MPLTPRLRSRTGEKERSCAEYLARQAVSAVWPDRRSRCCSISSWLKCSLLSAFEADPRRASGLSQTRASGCRTRSHLHSACPPSVFALPAHAGASVRVPLRFCIHRLSAHRLCQFQCPPTAAPEQFASKVRLFSDAPRLAEPTLGPSGFPDPPVAHVAW